MDNYNAERLKQDFIEPLAELVSLLASDVKRLEQAIKSGQLPRDYLPLNHIQAQDAVARLKRFRREEVNAKLEAALEGSLRFREAELAAEKAKRASARKKSQKK